MQRSKIMYFSGFLGYGGSERQLFLLLSHLDKRRYEPHVVVFNQSPNETYQAALEAAGVRVWQIAPDCKGIADRVRFLYQLVRTVRPHIIHSWTFHDNAYAAVVGRLAGVRLRWGSLRNAYGAREVQHLPPHLRWIALHGVGRLLVNTTAIRKELTALGVAAERILYLPNCVKLQPASQQLPDLGALGIAPGQPTVAIVGNLRHQKNHLMFVEVMAEVVRRIPQARGLIVGQPIPLNPGVATAIEKRIAALNLQQHVIMTGFRDDVPQLLRSVDLVALTSHYEGMPNAVMEAMAAARPVVATRVGGVPDLVEEGVNGCIVAAGDVGRFADAVCALLSDATLARRMGERGYEIIRTRFDCANVTRQLDEIYQQHLSSA